MVGPGRAVGRKIGIPAEAGRCGRVAQMRGRQGARIGSGRCRCPATGGTTPTAARSVDVVVANPPWFESDDERRNACGGAPRRDGAAEATAAETVRDDGEVGFCAALIEDALRLQSRVTWHSALLGRKQSLRRVLALLRERGISRAATTTIDLGRTARWAVAFPWPRARRRGRRARLCQSGTRPATWPCPRTARFRSSASAAPRRRVERRRHGVRRRRGRRPLARPRRVPRRAPRRRRFCDRRAGAARPAPCRRAPPTRSPDFATDCRATSRGRIGGGGGSWR